jgi:hypothetical protein
MTESYPPNNFPRWKRPLISGLISAGMAGICFGLLLYNPRTASGSIVWFLLLGFLAPGLLDQSASRVVSLLIVIVFWFLIGTGIGHLFRKNWIAIGVWLIVYAISFGLSLALFAEMNY